MNLQKFALTDKVAIVTGAGRGIGKAIALSFAEVGADVVVAARTAREVEDTAKEIQAKGRRALAVPTDVRESEQITNMVQKTVESFGRIDILVNNAGGAFRSQVLELSERGWDTIIRENLKSVFLCCKAVATVMVEQEKGNIINITSRSGQGPSPGMAPYAAAKAAVFNLTQTLAVEWAPYHIRVNAIAPGNILTEGVSHLHQLSPESPIAPVSVPLIRYGRHGEPDDVAAAAIYLASDASEYVTGQTIDVNGGPIHR